VVTYVAVVTFSNNDGRLLPGMTANVRVVTDQRESTLKVPNAALRVRIAGVEPAPYAPENVAADAAPAGAAGQNGSEKPAAATAPTPTPAPGGAGRPGGQGGGAAAEFRNRMAGELKLTPEQLEKVDAIYASMRPRFMQLRDLPDAERGRARERITAEVRARIGELLTPEQKQRYVALAAESSGRTITRGRIYLLGEDGKPKAFNARLGITDGSSTELVVAPNSPEAAELKEGAAVITGTVAPGSPATPSRTGASGPRMMF